MKKSSGAAWFTVCVLLVLGTVLWFVVKVPAEQLLSLGAGAVFLLWQVLLLTVPWSLYFQARGVARQVRIARERGIDVPAARAAEADRIARRLRLLAIGGHLVSAAVVAVITYFSGRSIGYYFSGFYLLSTVFRPAQAYFHHLRAQLGTMMQEAKFPPDDLRTFKTKVEKRLARLDDLAQTAQRDAHTLLKRINESYARTAQVDLRVSEVESAGRRRADEWDQRLRDRADAADTRTDAQLAVLRAADAATVARIAALTDSFEEALAGVTANQDLLTGLKAFLRVMRAESA